MKIIHRYFWRASKDVTLVMEFAELLLVLLRDDCVLVRNEAADIVLSLTNPNRADNDVVQKGTHERPPEIRSSFYFFFFERPRLLALQISEVRHRLSSHKIKNKTFHAFVAVIPLVAEDRLLEWLSGVFANSKGSNTWQLWLDLIMRTNSDECDADDIDLNENEANAENSNDIFEANEINMFGETVYISFKCYQQLMRSIEASGKSAEEIVSLQEQIYTKLPMLRDF